METTKRNFHFWHQPGAAVPLCRVRIVQKSRGEITIPRQLSENCSRFKPVFAAVHTIAVDSISHDLARL